MQHKRADDAVEYGLVGGLVGTDNIVNSSLTTTTTRQSHARGNAAAYGFVGG